MLSLIEPFYTLEVELRKFCSKIFISDSRFRVIITTHSTSVTGSSTPIVELRVGEPILDLTISLKLLYFLVEFVGAPNLTPGVIIESILSTNMLHLD